MKLSSILEMQRGRPRAEGHFSMVVNDPKTGKELEIEFTGEFDYDSGDVGFGVGPGKSPYQPSFEFDGAEVAAPFVFMGRQFKEGDDFDVDAFAKYATEAERKRVDNEIHDFEPEDDRDEDHRY